MSYLGYKALEIDDTGEIIWTGFVLINSSADEKYTKRSIFLYRDIGVMADEHYNLCKGLDVDFPKEFTILSEEKRNILLEPMDIGDITDFRANVSDLIHKIS